MSWSARLPFMHETLLRHVAGRKQASPGRFGLFPETRPALERGGDMFPVAPASLQHLVSRSLYPSGPARPPPGSGSRWTANPCSRAKPTNIRRRTPGRAADHTGRVSARTRCNSRVGPDRPPPRRRASHMVRMMSGTTRISGVPGTAAPVKLAFLDRTGSKAGRLLSSGHRAEIHGVHAGMRCCKARPSPWTERPCPRRRRREAQMPSVAPRMREGVPCRQSGTPPRCARLNGGVAAGLAEGETGVETWSRRAWIWD